MKGRKGTPVSPRAVFSSKLFGNILWYIGTSGSDLTKDKKYV